MGALRWWTTCVLVWCFWASDAAATEIVDPALTMVARNPSGASVRLPVVAETMVIAIDGQHATTRWHQSYHNDSSAVVEGLFSFQGGQGAQVTAFAYWNGSQKIVGEVFEKSLAEALYYNTVEMRRDPGLLEKSGEGAFDFRVYPIQPRERKRVELQVEQWLSRRDRVVEYRMPVSSQRAEIDAVIRDARGIRNVVSPSHRIDTAGDKKRVQVRVGEPLRAARELVLRYELADRPYQLSAAVHRGADGEAFFVATVAAPHVSSVVTQDLTLVIDTTMGEADVKLAKLAAKRIISSLHAGDRINVVDVGKSRDRLYAEPRWMSERVRDEALQAVRDLVRQNMGKLVDVLPSALVARAPGPRSRNVMVLTNGKSGTLSEIRDLLERRGSTRVFALGIGRHADGATLGRMATLGGGAFVHVANEASLSAAVTHLVAQIAAPLVTGARLSARGGEIDDVYPNGDSILYQGRELRYVGRLRGEGNVTLVLSGRAHQPVELGVRLDMAAASEHRWIARLWAGERVAHLLEEIALHGESSDSVKEATELAVAYDIVTPYTAFLAIPESEMSWHDKMTLDEARRRKRALIEQRPELLGMMPPHTATAEPSTPPLASEHMDVGAGGGCAGCHVGARAPLRPGIWLMLAVGLSCWHRRRKTTPAESGARCRRQRVWMPHRRRPMRRRQHQRQPTKTAAHRMSV